MSRFLITNEFRKTLIDETDEGKYYSEKEDLYGQRLAKDLLTYLKLSFKMYTSKAYVTYNKNEFRTFIIN